MMRGFMSLLFVVGMLLWVALAVGCAPKASPSACWAAADTVGVYGACRKGGGGHDDCVCYTQALQQISPNPDTRATDEEHLSAAASCGLSVELTAPKAEQGTPTFDDDTRRSL